MTQTGEIAKTPRAVRLSENPACNPLCRVCHYKDLTYPEQLVRKQAWADRQLSQWSGLLAPIDPAPAHEREAYRAKTWLRAEQSSGQLSFGMHRAIHVEGGWEKEFISWDTCPLHVRPIQEMISRLRNVLPHSAPSFTQESLVGIWMGNPHLVLISRSPLDERLRDLDWNAVLHAPFDRVWFHQNDQVGRKIFGHREILQLAGPPVEDVHPIRAFRQIAQTLLSRAREAAVSALTEKNPELVLDLYCGTGELSNLIPGETGWLGIELSKEAIRYANTLREGTVSVHRGFTGLIEQRLRDPKVQTLIPESYAIYINPPRSGMSEEAWNGVRQLLNEKCAKTVVYLSCSASSLARDLRNFEAHGYQVRSLKSFDFFPQTEHFETLAVLVRC